MPLLRARRSGLSCNQAVNGQLAGPKIDQLAHSLSYDQYITTGISSDSDAFSLQFPPYRIYSEPGRKDHEAIRQGKRKKKKTTGARRRTSTVHGTDVHSCYLQLCGLYYLQAPGNLLLARANRIEQGILLPASP